MNTGRTVVVKSYNYELDKWENKDVTIAGLVKIAEDYGQLKDGMLALADCRGNKFVNPADAEDNSIVEFYGPLYTSNPENFTTCPKCGRPMLDAGAWGTDGEGADWFYDDANDRYVCSEGCKEDTP